jgi:hypothetical protein
LPGGTEESQEIDLNTSLERYATLTCSTRDIIEQRKAEIKEGRKEGRTNESKGQKEQGKKKLFTISN